MDAIPSSMPCLSEPSFWASADREKVFARLRDHHPVTWQEEPETIWSERGRGYWAVVRHEDIRSVTRDPGRFVSGLGTELFDLPVEVARSYSGMLNMDVPEHTRFRAYVTEAFSVRRVEDTRGRHPVDRLARSSTPSARTGTATSPKTSPTLSRLR